MIESQLFDGKHCPRCGAEIEVRETENWEQAMTCPVADHWGRVSGYKETPVLER